MNRIVLIAGPTGVGKTSLSTKICNEFNGKLISCDSMQIYRDMNIGTSKITEEEQKKYPHALIDIVNPNEEFSVSMYKDLAEKEIDKAIKEKKLPIIVGGTGLYMRALLFPYSFNNSNKNEDLRKYYENLVETNGKEYVFNILKQKSPEIASKLHFNDTKRVIRKLEMLETSAIKQDELKSNYNYELIVLNEDRESLYEKINKRVDEMFDEGLLNEVERIIKKYNLTKFSQSMQAIGYREFFDYFENKIDYLTLKNLIKQHTRNYAKRQITWFKTMPNAVWFNVNDKEKIIDYLKTKLN